ncbi:possible RND family outer membrane efflux protein [Prochlorococcus marinus str. MIT 9515]|uniref:Possible RND family outer membrane efflux protein n=1 Tax=Prochlorococcus marinus (strain MIT 9515) TaxID=167542 RepID=A2BU57_PROM5|nr:TolC family protein [Prochlorococcus marinus]ABM71318.1 possible RND family outer membrane efflux protein [Prochlorococcus marinus str. MIT 9515]
MLRKLIHPVLFFPLFLFINSQKAVLSGSNNNIEAILEENETQIFLNYSEIKNITLKNNQELKALENLVDSSTFTLSSKIAKRYPSLDLQASGFPKYVSGKNYNSTSSTTKTSQFSANPSLNIRLDLIDPLRGSEIQIAKNNYAIARNNYEIKKKDLIQEAKSRYHKLQKSYQDIKNKKSSLDLSVTSLKDAKSKFDAGIGTKFEVLEANAQLSRDRQTLNEKKIQNQINKIALKEILNINGDFDINKKQKLIGFWNHKLNKNINEGLLKSLSLKNITLQKAIKENQAKNYLNTYKPNVYISNVLTTSFSKGDSLAVQIDSGKSGSAYTNTVSLNFGWNIFDGGQNKNLYKSSIADAQSEDYSYRNLENVIKSKISKAYLNLKLNEEKIISSLEEISSTEESLRLARLRYEVGISTLKDVLVRQKELSNANSKNIDAIYNYNLNLDELERLTYLEISNICDESNGFINNDIKSICNI